jgi:hypothetical protein
MKTKTNASFSTAHRCNHVTSTGRQCCSLATGRSGLCARHAAAQANLQARDYARLLLRGSKGFQTAGGINYSLGDLYSLLAQGRISPRRAAVLAYISSLLLRTLPAIDKDRAPNANRFIDLGPEAGLGPFDAAAEAPTEETEAGSDLSASDPEEPGKSSKPN